MSKKQLVHRNSRDCFSLQLLVLLILLHSACSTDLEKRPFSEQEHRFFREPLAIFPECADYLFALSHSSQTHVAKKPHKPQTASTATIQNKHSNGYKSAENNNKKKFLRQNTRTIGKNYRRLLSPSSLTPSSLSATTSIASSFSPGSSTNNMKRSLVPVSNNKDSSSTNGHIQNSNNLNQHNEHKRTAKSNSFDGNIIRNLYTLINNHSTYHSINNKPEPLSVIVIGAKDLLSLGLGNLLVFLPAILHFAILTNRVCVIDDFALLGQMCKLLVCKIPSIAQLRHWLFYDTTTTATATNDKVGQNNNNNDSNNSNYNVSNGKHKNSKDYNNNINHNTIKNRYLSSTDFSSDQEDNHNFEYYLLSKRRYQYLFRHFSRHDFDALFSRHSVFKTALWLRGKDLREIAHHKQDLYYRYPLLTFSGLDALFNDWFMFWNPLHHNNTTNYIADDNSYYDESVTSKVSSSDGSHRHGNDGHKNYNDSYASGFERSAARVCVAAYTNHNCDVNSHRSANDDSNKGLVNVDCTDSFALSLFMHFTTDQSAASLGPLLRDSAKNEVNAMNNRGLSMISEQLLSDLLPVYDVDNDNPNNDYKYHKNHYKQVKLTWLREAFQELDTHSDSKSVSVTTTTATYFNTNNNMKKSNINNNIDANNHVIINSGDKNYDVFAVHLRTWPLHIKQRLLPLYYENADNMNIKATVNANMNLQNSNNTDMIYDTNRYYVFSVALHLRNQFDFFEHEESETSETALKELNAFFGGNGNNTNLHSNSENESNRSLHSDIMLHVQSDAFVLFASLLYQILQQARLWVRHFHNNTDTNNQCFSVYIAADTVTVKQQFRHFLLQDFDTTVHSNNKKRKRFYMERCLQRGSVEEVCRMKQELQSLLTIQSYSRCLYTNSTSNKNNNDINTNKLEFHWFSVCLSDPAHLTASAAFHVKAAEHFTPNTNRSNIIHRIIKLGNNTNPQSNNNDSNNHRDAFPHNLLWPLLDWVCLSRAHSVFAWRRSHSRAQSTFVGSSHMLGRRHPHHTSGGASVCHKHVNRVEHSNRNNTPNNSVSTDTTNATNCRGDRQTVHLLVMTSYQKHHHYNRLYYSNNNLSDTNFYNMLLSTQPFHTLGKGKYHIHE